MLIYEREQYFFLTKYFLLNEIINNHSPFKKKVEKNIFN